jgi:hypothetical protein
MADPLDALVERPVNASASNADKDAQIAIDAGGQLAGAVGAFLVLRRAETVALRIVEPGGWSICDDGIAWWLCTTLMLVASPRRAGDFDRG